MDANIIFILGSIFFAVAAISGGIVWWLLTDRVRRRVADIQAPLRSLTHDFENRWMQRVIRFSQPLAKLSLPSGNWESSPLRLRLIHAGWRDKSAASLFLGSKTLLAIAFPLLFCVLFNEQLLINSSDSIFLTMVISSIVGYFLPNLFLQNVINRRQRELFEHFPDALDLLTICIDAGLGLDAAFKKVADEIHLKSKLLSQEFQLFLMELRTGFSKEQALRHLAIRSGVEEIEFFVAMIIQSDRFGTAMSESLKVHSEHLRVKRRQRAEEAAEKISLKLLFPLIFLIFPSLIVMLAGPAMLQIYRLLLPTMAG